MKGTDTKMKSIVTRTGRLTRTVQYLRASQITNRIARRIKPAPKLDGPMPTIRPAVHRWERCTGRTASLVSPNRFRFLALEGGLEEALGWNDPAHSKLWLYNLHYFDDCLAEGADERVAWHRELITRWISENPPMVGNGWEPYTISRRIVNWIAWQLGGNELPDSAAESLAQQARALAGSLEYHLLGNHILANAKALVFAGAFFEGAEANRWLQLGLAILASEIPEQVLEDGGHFELSPMYHALILEDLIDLVQLQRIFPGLAEPAQQQRWRDAAAAMLDWLAAMSHPDGNVAFFNDAAIGQARRHADLVAYANRFGILGSMGLPASVHLCHSGYLRLSAGPWVAFLDAAQVGASYIPGHAHADTLSLELSFDGQRFITNRGISTYATGSVRDAERGTASHATVEIDGKDSSEVWAGFRVGRRARPAVTKAVLGPETAMARVSHDGYRFLAGSPVHERKLEVRSDGVAITDRIIGSGRHEATGRFPLHPSVERIEAMRNGWRVTAPGGRIVTIVVDGPGAPFVEEGIFAPEFGVLQARPVLAWRSAELCPNEMRVELRA